jgi:hypothetical protein
VAVGFQQIVVTGVVGLAAGAAVYLYYNKYFDKILGGITLPGTEPDTTTTTTVTEFNFFARPKLQCRDDNITAAWLQQQGVKVLNFKIFYDNKFYPQVCGAPGGRYFLVATAKGDNSSEGILVSLGFTKYASTPAASDIDPNIQIPGYPPATMPLPLPVEEEPAPEPTPIPTPAVVAAIATDKANYIVGESITVIGTGFGAAETVELRFKYRDTAGDGHTIGTAYTVTTDANGAFASSLLKAVASTQTGQRYVQVKGLTSAKLVTKNITVSAAASGMSYAYLGEGDSYIGYPIYVAEMM